MTEESFEVFLHNEIPKFHSGWRKITVTEMGTKWVRLTYGRKKARLPRHKWAEILKNTAAYRHRTNHTR